MAASCLTIASKDGGVDGIIVDNENGYLCHEADNNELKRILENIMESDYKHLTQIVNHGYKTVQNYSDCKVAEKYLNDIYDL